MTHQCSKYSCRPPSLTSPPPPNRKRQIGETMKSQPKWPFNRGSTALILTRSARLFYGNSTAMAYHWKF